MDGFFVAKLQKLSDNHPTVSNEKDGKSSVVTDIETPVVSDSMDKKRKHEGSQKKTFSSKKTKTNTKQTNAKITKARRMKSYAATSMNTM
jgi:hypothetical protein